jgi:alkylated DNA repair dioxygenase AlkB
MGTKLGPYGPAPEGFQYFPDFLAAQQADELLAYLQNLAYRHDACRGRAMKRGYAQFGHRYDTARRKALATLPIPDFIAELLTRAARAACVAQPFDQVICTVYPKGAQIGWHTDAPCFDNCIIGISIGSPATMQFRHGGSEEPGFAVELQPGSMYVLQGEARRNYEHRIARVKNSRYSLTFRRVPL